MVNWHTARVQLRGFRLLHLSRGGIKLPTLEERGIAQGTELSYGSQKISNNVGYTH